ncbi:MAG TPA: lyase [Thermoanaerobaculia bacterium]|jgi:virginiamycin B lyase|nr:lyase [Thermoanaerobaculia bacterium]
MRRAIILTSTIYAALAFAATSVNVSIHEYDLPTPSSRPHDPAVGADGALWYTAQQANAIGRLDPATGEVKQFPLKTAHSGPHGLVSDAAGNIWFTANYAAYIGKLDPKTGNVTEYKIADPRGEDPHTPAIAPDGRVWFTVQQGNVVGVLDPKSGAVKLTDVPTPHALPYGLVINSKGVPYFCEFGSNKITGIDPATMQLREFKLPEGARPRRLALANDTTIYYSDFRRGYLGRLDTSTGAVKEWPSPGGADSHPYGIAITRDGIVWYSESGVKPNTLVRFDPKTGDFQKWNIPSGGGVVRNMAATKDGRLYLACSGVNKVAVARVE